MPNNSQKDVTGWVGWVYFAGMLMILIGIFQAIAGLVALLKDSYFLVTNQGLVAFDYTTWGWIHLILGVVIAAAGAAVVNGRSWGRVIAVILVSLSALSHFLFMPAYPIWSIIALVIDIILLYALIVHGAEAEA